MVPRREGVPQKAHLVLGEGPVPGPPQSSEPPGQAGVAIPSHR